MAHAAVTSVVAGRDRGQGRVHGRNATSGEKGRPPGPAGAAAADTGRGPEQAETTRTGRAPPPGPPCSQSTLTGVKKCHRTHTMYVTKCDCHPSLA